MYTANITKQNITIMIEEIIKIVLFDLLCFLLLSNSLYRYTKEEIRNTDNYTILNRLFHNLCFKI